MKRYNQRTGGFIGAHKYFDRDQSATIGLTIADGLHNPTSFDCLTAVSGVGTSSIVREANKILITSLQINGLITPDLVPDQDDPLPGAVIKIVLLWDKQTNGAQYDPITLFEVTAGRPILAMRDVEHIERFQVLKEWTIHAHRYAATNDHATNSSTMSSTGQEIAFSYFKKFNFLIKFKDTGSTVSSVMDHSLHLYAISSQPNWKLSYSSRCNFKG